MKLAEQPRFTLARRETLSQLARVRELANPKYTVDMAGFWLERWRRERSVELGRPKPQRCRRIAAEV